MPPPRIIPSMRHIVRRHSAPRSLCQGVRVPSVSPIVAKMPAVETIGSAHGVRVVAFGTLIVECETVGATVAGKGDGTRVVTFVLVLVLVVSHVCFGVLVKLLFWIWNWSACSWSAFSWIACLISG
jgi:hypothetical protein